MKKNKKAAVADRISELTAEYCSCVNKLYKERRKLNKLRDKQASAEADIGQYAAAISNAELNAEGINDSVDTITFKADMLEKSHSDIEGVFKDFRGLKLCAEAAEINQKKFNRKVK